MDPKWSSIQLFARLIDVIYSCLDRLTGRLTVQPFNHSTIQDLTVWPFKTLQFGLSRPYSLAIQDLTVWLFKTLQFGHSRPYTFNLHK